MVKSLMRVPVWLLSLLIVGAFFTVHSLPAHAQGSSPSADAAPLLSQPNNMPVPPFVPGTILVGLRGEAGVAAASPDALWGDLTVLAVEPLDVRRSAVSAASADTTVTGYKLTVPAGTEWAAVETLLAREDVLFAEPDWLAQIAQAEPQNSAPYNAMPETPYFINDPLYREQWYLQRIRISRGWSLARQEAGGALDRIQVVVIDTGVDFTHPDLAGKLESGYNYLNSTDTAHDDNGHGTHISGLIAAAANGAGMVGSGLEVEIIPFKALNANGVGGVSGIGQAIRDAADLGVEIINLSLEISIDTFALNSAVEYAVSAGALVIAASGNQGRMAVSYPAAYPGVLAVGASTYNDGRAYYSNQGPELDIMAPGGLGGPGGRAILSTWTRDVGARCPAGLRQVNGGVYCEAVGTSMATGITTGVAALLLSLRPDLDADAVQAMLLESAAPMTGSASEVGRGRLDAGRAIRLAMEPRLIYAETASTASTTQGRSPFKVTLPLANPSLKPLYVEVAPTMTTTWFTLATPNAGAVSYGKPLEVQLLITPTALPSGTFQSSLRVTTTAEGEGVEVYFINTSLAVFPEIKGEARMYLTWIGAPGEFHWVEPHYTERTNHALTDDSSIVLDLPFTMTLQGQSFGDVRVYADGFVTSAADLVENFPNTCLANQTSPAFAVYGWWSDLSMADDSALSTFQPDANRFVIEYQRFVMAGSDEQISFQIVLHRNGQVALNYRETPDTTPAGATVGVSVADGRFYNQIACHVAGSTRIGDLPQDHQSFIFNPRDFY